jgi:ATP adenylyltransferase
LGYIQAGAAAVPAERELTWLPGAEPNCFLCRAAADADDRTNLVVARGQHTFVVLNRFPYNNGHLMVCPLEHRATLDQLTAELHLELSETITRLVGILSRAMQAEGFNIGLNLGRAAGAGVPGHLHWHIVPRWTGDTNFMPVLADTSVLPQSLDALFDLLRGEWNC